MGLTVTDSYLWLDNWYNKLWVKLEVASGSLVVIPFGGRRLFIVADRDYISLEWGSLVAWLLIAFLPGIQMNSCPENRLSNEGKKFQLNPQLIVQVE